MGNLAYLSLGSNIDPEENFRKALELLSACGVVRQVSTVWETLPLGDRPQANFLNAVVLLETDLDAQALKDSCLTAIESQLGRTRSSDPFGPRTMDIDVLLFNHDILSIGHRQVPNPEIQERAFVAIPLAEIAPGYIHPVTGQSLESIAHSFGDISDIMSPRSDFVRYRGNKPDSQEV